MSSLIGVLERVCV